MSSFFFYLTFLEICDIIKYNKNKGENMNTIIEDMQTLTEGIGIILDRTADEYGEFSDEYDFVVRVYDMAKALTEELRKKGE